MSIGSKILGELLSNGVLPFKNFKFCKAPMISIPTIFLQFCDLKNVISTQQLFQFWGPCAKRIPAKGFCEKNAPKLSEFFSEIVIPRQ